MGDRGAHVGRPQLREHRAVTILDERVHDALRMHHDLDLLRRDAEQETRLDQLQALVHQRSGVDRDLATHHPVRVSARGLGGDRGEGLSGEAAERAAGSCQKNAPHSRRRLARACLRRQTLKDRVVLTIDR